MPRPPRPVRSRWAGQGRVPAHLPGRGRPRIPQTSATVLSSLTQASVPRPRQHPSPRGGLHLASVDMPWVLTHTCLHLTPITTELVAIQKHIREQPGPGRGVPGGRGRELGVGVGGQASHPCADRTAEVDQGQAVPAPCPTGWGGPGRTFLCAGESAGIPHRVSLPQDPGPLHGKTARRGTASISQTPHWGGRPLPPPKRHQTVRPTARGSEHAAGWGSTAGRRGGASLREMGARLRTGPSPDTRPQRGAALPGLAPGQQLTSGTVPGARGACSRKALFLLQPRAVAMATARPASPAPASWCPADTAPWRELLSSPWPCPNPFSCSARPPRLWTGKLYLSPAGPLAPSPPLLTHSNCSHVRPPPWWAALPCLCPSDRGPQAPVPRAQCGGVSEGGGRRLRSVADGARRRASGRPSLLIHQAAL